MLLLIDNYDSFTYNLKDYFEQLGQPVQVISNDQIFADNLPKYKFDKIVLSPGPNRPTDAGNLMSIIQATYLHYPILGVCLGHQALGEFFGATLNHAHRPMHGKVSEIKTDQKNIYQNLPQHIKVCRYHSLVLENIDERTLTQTATTAENECMSFMHNTLPITGIQYHPEAILTEHGLQILKNWLISIK